jgi:hypothetical protein
MLSGEIESLEPGDYCKSSDKTLGSIKYGEFLYQLRNYKLFKKDFATWS